jgi:hypothetical protein
MGFRSNHPGATCIVRPARGSRGGASSSAFIADPRDNFTMEVSFYHNPGASAACIETGGGPRLFDNCGRARIFCAVIPGVPRSGKIPNP